MKSVPWLTFVLLVLSPGAKQAAASGGYHETVVTLKYALTVQQGVYEIPLPNSRPPANPYQKPFLNRIVHAVEASMRTMGPGFFRLIDESKKHHQYPRLSLKNSKTHRLPQPVFVPLVKCRLKDSLRTSVSLSGIIQDVPSVEARKKAQSTFCRLVAKRMQSKAPIGLSRRRTVVDLPKLEVRNPKKAYSVVVESSRTVQSDLAYFQRARKELASRFQKVILEARRNISRRLGVRFARARTPDPPFVRYAKHTTHGSVDAHVYYSAPASKKEKVPVETKNEISRLSKIHGCTTPYAPHRWMGS